MNVTAATEPGTPVQIFTFEKGLPLLLTGTLVEHEGDNGYARVSVTAEQRGNDTREFSSPRARVAHESLVYVKEMSA